jgi:CMP-N-acetylneuraminic acid synthetase
MKKEKDVAIIIQARLNSTRIPKKMIRPFGNTTLFDLAIQKALASKVREGNIWVSIHEKELLDIAKTYPVNVFKRSEASANAGATQVSEVFEWFNKIPYKHCVVVSACCPFLNPQTIKEFVDRYVQNDWSEQLSVVEKRNNLWTQDNERPILIDKQKGLDTSTMIPFLEVAHCLYAGCLDDIGQNIWMRNPKLFTISEKEALDIDYPWQFDMYDKVHSKH